MINNPKKNSLKIFIVFFVLPLILGLYLGYSFSIRNILEYYPNGAKKIYGKVVNGKYAGVLKEFYQDGSIKKITFYYNGQKEGKETYYLPFRFSSKKNMLLYLKQKTKIFFNNDFFGQTTKVYFYQNGHFQGKQIEYYANGKIKAEYFYKDGVLLKNQTKEYTPYGKLILKANKQVVPKVVVKKKVSRPKVKLETKPIIKITKSEIQPTSAPLLRNGLQIDYYPDGRVKREAFYSNDILNGIVREYYPDGTLALEENLYENGILTGMFKRFYKNGALMLQVPFQSGTRNGEFVQFYENQDLQMKVVYKDSVPIGRIKKYYPAAGKQNFFQEIFQSIIRFVDPSYNTGVEYEADFVNGVLSGPAKTYYPSGMLKQKLNYKNGLLDGEVINYFENGMIMSKNNYVAGQKQYNDTIYYPDGEQIIVK